MLARILATLLFFFMLENATFVIRRNAGQIHSH